MAAVSPPKPWEIRRQQGASSTALPVSTTPGASSSSVTTSPSGPAVPLRPTSMANSTLNRPWGSSYNSPYSSYGNSYGSGYGSGYGSSYGSYGGYGSYGSSGYGSSYGSGYGSGYGGYGSYRSPYSSYGSSYGGYGSGYGGYGYNRYGGPLDNRDPRAPGFQQSIQGHMQNFGQVAEGFSRFSRLLDANFDAVHGSFASIMRLIDVAGEFIYVVKAFAIGNIFYGGISSIGRLFRWLLFGADMNKLTQGKSGAPLDLKDFVQYQQNEQRRRKLLPVLLIMLGISLVSAPMLLVRLFRKLSSAQLLESASDSPEKVWNGNPEDPNQPIPVQAVHDFRGQAEHELDFNRDDRFIVTGKPYPEWWEGEINGRRGLFPANHVQPLTPPNNNDPNTPPREEPQKQ